MHNKRIAGYEDTIRGLLSRIQANENLIRRYEGITKYTNNGIAVYKAINDGADFIIVDFNPAGEKIEHVKKAQLLGKSIKEGFPGVEDFGILPVLKRVFKTGNPEHFPIAQYKDSRINGWRNNYIFRLPSMEVVAVYTDETKRKIDQDKINFFATLHNENPYPVLRIDQDTRILYSNYAANLIIEQLKDPRKNGKFFLNRELSVILQATIASGNHEQVELKCAERTYLLNFVPISKKSYVNIYGQDVTELQKAEERTLRVNLEKSELASNLLSEVLEIMTGIAHLKDNETYNHLQRMSYSFRFLLDAVLSNDLLSKQIISDAEELFYIRTLGPEIISILTKIHDIGKVGVKEEILYSALSPLPNQYIEEMRAHVRNGITIIEAGEERIKKNLRPYDIRILALYYCCRRIIEDHHEKYNGKGYPNGKSGNNISFLGRAVTIMDVIDALLSKRRYKEKWTPEEVRKYLEENKDIQFDPTLVDIVLRKTIWNKIIRIQNKYQD